MSGYAICTRIKKDKSLKEIPLVITSAEATEETFEHHKKLKTRAEEYLRKPFEPEVLIDVLSRYLPFSDVASDDIDVEEVVEVVDDEILEPADLSQGAGLSQYLSPDEMLTAVGVSPQRMAQLDAQLREMQDQLTVLQKERDEAVASERAARRVGTQMVTSERARGSGCAPRASGANPSTKSPQSSVSTSVGRKVAPGGMDVMLWVLAKAFVERFCVTTWLAGGRIRP